MNVPGIPEPGGWKDPLTGLEGPDAWRHTLVAEVARAARYGRELTIVVLDVAGISELVEELGGELGEDVARHAVREAGEGLLSQSRTSDRCFRTGLTRFGVVLPETDEVAAINYVERVRELVPRQMSTEGTGVRLAFGWASPTAGESADMLIRRASHRLVREQLAEA